MAAPPPGGGLEALAACASLTQRLSLNLSEVLGEAAALPDGPLSECRRTGAETSAAPPPSPASAASSPRSPRPRRTAPAPPPVARPPQPQVKREPAMAASPVGQLDARFVGATAARQGGDLQALLAQHAAAAAAQHGQHAAGHAQAQAQLAATAGGAAAVAHYDYSALAALRLAAPRPPLPGLTPENPLPSKLIGRAAQAVLRPPPALTLGGGGGGWLAAPPGTALGALGGAAPTTVATGAAGAPELDLSALQRLGFGPPMTSGFGPPDGFAPPAPPAGRGRGRARGADADADADAGGGDAPPARRRRTAAAGAARPPRGRRASDETEADGAPAPPAPAPAAPAPERSSRFRGVTKHRRSGRFEAHIWVKDLARQVYLGGYEAEEHAAEAYDIAALKAKGRGAKTNFELDKYEDLLACIDRMTVEELVMAVRRQSQGFSRGTSAFRGVTRHPSARWEARIGVPGSKHVYLGLFVDEKEAARAYDRALVRLRGRAAATNFSLAEYRLEMADYHRMESRLHRDDPRFAEISADAALFERWVKSGCETFPELASPSGEAAAAEPAADAEAAAEAPGGAARAASPAASPAPRARAAARAGGHVGMAAAMAAAAAARSSPMPEPELE